MSDSLQSYKKHLPFLANFLTESLYVPVESVQGAGADSHKQEPNTAAEAASEPENVTNEQPKAIASEAREAPAIYQPSETASEHRSSETQKADIPVYGDFKQGILVLVDYPTPTPLVPKDRLILQNILKALGLGFSDVAVVNIRNPPNLTYQQITSKYPPASLIGFGLPKDLLPTNPNHYQPDTLSNGEGILLADPLADIAVEKQLKKQLWHGLQKLFNLA